MVSIRELSRLRQEVEELQEREAARLFRLSRKAMEHGCDIPFCVRIRSEAWLLKGLDVGALLDGSFDWEFAFNLDGGRTMQERRRADFWRGAEVIAE